MTDTLRGMAVTVIDTEGRAWPVAQAEVRDGQHVVRLAMARCQVQGVGASLGEACVSAAQAGGVKVVLIRAEKIAGNSAG